MNAQPSAKSSDIPAWFRREVPTEWFEGDLQVDVDSDEILLVGRLPVPDGSSPPEAASDFRGRTRTSRIAIAERAEHVFRRKVSWGVRCGDETFLYTHLAVPVMTRLRMPERQLLDLLVEGRVARSRSEALAWCVRLVSRNEAEWLADMQDALQAVRAVRAEAPRAV